MSFKNEVLWIAKFNRNLAALIGFCVKDEKKLVVKDLQTKMAMV